MHYTAQSYLFLQIKCLKYYQYDEYLNVSKIIDFYFVFQSIF